jgi:hypothetical protein
VVDGLTHLGLNQVIANGIGFVLSPHGHAPATEAELTS